MTRLELALLLSTAALTMGQDTSTHTTCYKNEDLDITGGFCHPRSLEISFCGPTFDTPTDKARFKNMAAAAGGVVFATQEECDEYAEKLTDIYSAGCKAQGGKLKKDVLCNKDQYCDSMAGLMEHALKCTTDTDCPITEERTLLPCCSSLKDELEDRCSESDSDKLDAWIETQATSNECSKAADCFKFSSAATVRAAQITAYLAAVLVLVLGATV